MNRHNEMYISKDYSIIALAESLKRNGDQRKARFERSLRESLGNVGLSSVVIQKISDGGFVSF